MLKLSYTDHLGDPASWAKTLEISRDAVDIYLGSDVIDLHVDSFIWHRVFGYDLTRRHDQGILGARGYSQVDFPRIREAGVTGATWVITTNPARPRSERVPTLEENLRDLRSIFAQVPADFAVVTTAQQYREARRQGKHGAFIGIQGGNALDEDLSLVDRLPPGLLLRITLVHLSTSSLGSTSSPLRLGPDAGLSDAGRRFVEFLNSRKIFVDLAHISKKGFWDALAVHDRTQPILVTHTGISGVFEHWRNLDDAQVRAVAELGGTIGIMYQSSFLGDRYLGGSAKRIVDHIDHVIQITSDDHVSLGSDWDGAIVTPRDMPTCLELPRLVQLMLERGYSTERIQKILGRNFLRVVESLRG